MEQSGRSYLRNAVALGFVSAMIAMLAIGVTATPAAAYEYEHIYCENIMEPGGTCPPSGSSEYAHLQVNEGDAGGQSHETCIDEYLTGPKKYTSQKCMYYAGEEAVDTPGGEYGYPRAWNGGSATHAVDAVERGYHTAAVESAITSPLTPSGISASGLPTAVVQGLSNYPGIDLATAQAAGSTYPAWVITGSTETCLMHEGMRPGDVPGGVCGPTSVAQERGLAITTENAAGAAVIFGLAPAGNTSVSVIESDGAARNVPVTNGVYEVTGGNPNAVRLSAASGEATTRHLAALSSVPPASAPAGS
ncbi:MAG: hypothetical protein WB698_00670 [Solirubrobacteraceae bacterium]